MTENETHTPEKPYRSFSHDLAIQVARRRAAHDRGGRRQQIRIVPAPDPFVGKVLFEVTEKGH